MKKHLIIHNDAELPAYLDYCVYGLNPEKLPSIKFSKEMIKASEFKLLKQKRK